MEIDQQLFCSSNRKMSDLDCSLIGWAMAHCLSEHPSDILNKLYKARWEIRKRYRPYPFTHDQAVHYMGLLYEGDIPNIMEEAGAFISTLIAEHTRNEAEFVATLASLLSDFIATKSNITNDRLEILANTIIIGICIMELFLATQKRIEERRKEKQ